MLAPMAFYQRCKQGQIQYYLNWCLAIFYQVSLYIMNCSQDLKGAVWQRTRNISSKPVLRAVEIIQQAWSTCFVCQRPSSILSWEIMNLCSTKHQPCGSQPKKKISVLRAKVTAQSRTGYPPPPKKKPKKQIKDKKYKLIQKCEQ